MRKTRTGSPHRHGRRSHRTAATARDTTGTDPVSVVPTCSVETTFSEPPSASKRSVRFVSPAPFLTVARSKPAPSSWTMKWSVSSSARSRTTARVAAGVLLDVLHRLEAAEVDRRFHVLRIALDVLGLDGDRDRGLARLRLQRHDKPFVGKQRWVDASRQIAQRVESLVGVTLQLDQGELCLVRVPPAAARQARA